MPNRSLDARLAVLPVVRFESMPSLAIYPTAMHGWCVPDMPLQPNGMPIYNKEAAERAWAKLVALYKTALV